MKVFDISPVISAKTAVFPGDCSFSRKEVMSCKEGDHLTLSQMTTTMHIGAHADAPNHYSKEGVGIADRALDYYLGPCQVIHVEIERGQRIAVADIDSKDIIQERVLFYTNSFPDPNHWNSDFNSFSPELIDFLHSKGVRLVGIDTPSVDPEDSKKLESHARIHKNDMAILEGIVLSDVPEGIYELIALPLKIHEADASPVRAVLRELS